MSPIDKFFLICKRYGFFQKKFNPEYIEEILVRYIMLKAYEKHGDIDFKSFVRECIADPVNYYELHLLNNCFNDRSAVHYGLKVDNVWYFNSDPEDLKKFLKELGLKVKIKKSLKSLD